MVVALAILLFGHLAYAQESPRQLYSQARRALKLKKLDFAFLHFNTIVDKHPDSKYAQKSLLAMGEYYFSTAAYYEATLTFKRFIEKYPDSAAEPFAKVYLLKIAQIEKNNKLAKDLEHQIINSQQLSLVFRDFKEHKYLSALSKDYKAVYFIDRMEFYIDEELFAKIVY